MQRKVTGLGGVWAPVRTVLAPGGVLRPARDPGLLLGNLPGSAALAVTCSAATVCWSVIHGFVQTTQE